MIKYVDKTQYVICIHREICLKNLHLDYTDEVYNNTIDAST